MTTNRAFEIRSGYSHTLGANYDGEGVNFAIFSAHAERVELCLYDPSGEHEIARLELPEYTDEIWHGYVTKLQPGALYGYRVYGPYDPENGHRFNPNKLLIDPYARELVGDIQWNDAHFAYQLLHDDKDLTFDDQDSAPFTPKCRVIDPAEANWEDRQRPSIPWSNAIIYETHVKGFTQLNSAIPEPLRGTFEGMGHKASVDYIKSLGITSVELLPVHWFPDDQHLLDKGLKNFWGYNSLGFFAPATRYYGPKGIQGFRDMVRAFHDAGVEVILDVVYNHTAEGNELGPTLSFKGIDNFSYYRTMPDQHRYYINDTGTGNTVNTSHPRVLQMVMDSLRYWAESMHVDGFRFDLGTILGREPEGFDQRGGFFDAVTQDPVLAKLKLIGEPWDIGPGGYQVGGFPPGWGEWNDKYRDTVREYWKGDNVTNDFAARLLGSGDLYDLRGRRLLGKVEGAIYAQRSTQLSATLLGIDPVIYSNHMFLHEWTTEQLVKDYGKLNPLSSEEQAITMGLSAAEVKFLTALSDLELKKIRERGQLESLRHELRISRHDLQGKRVQDKRVQINRIRAASRQGRDQTYGPEVF
ncbi:glycogen debranching protein GlgX [Salmonella enterica subsp. enterica serovar Typhi]|nr:glycogen debranching protein GlgX [Salmonella enterica subsp. enterica serovar Typhi]CHK42124.1 glycogen debranching protein GlgX [Salmonella enterica subsp. enterica serovar Typhi]